MSRSTKLFQRPGSPLIQGHSKAERSFLGEWALGLVVCCVAAFAVFIYLGLDPESAFGTRDLIEAARSTLTLFAPGAAVGAAVGVPFARGFGWRRHWQSVAAFGLVFGAASAWLLGLAGA